MKEEKNMVDNEFVSIVPDLSRYMAALMKLLQRFYYVQIGKRLFLPNITSFNSHYVEEKLDCRETF